MSNEYNDGGDFDLVVIGNLHRDCDERIVFESSGELHIKDGMPVYGADSVAPLQAEIERQTEQYEKLWSDFVMIDDENEKLRKGMTGDYDLDAWLDFAKERDQLKARCDELEKDAALLDYLQDQLVDTIYLDDGRIIDIAGRVTVREGVHAHMSKPAGSQSNVD